MTIILFSLCFALLAVAFFLIILLYLKVTQLKDVEMKQERLLNEFENVITSYVMEIKEENEMLLHRIQQMKQEPEIISEKVSEQKTSMNIENNKDVVVKDIDHLFKLGLSYEEIAKKLKRGITEIELIHKFHQNN